MGRKRTKDTISIYMITCVVNGKQYIGQTKDYYNSRWSSHKYAAKKGAKGCVLFWRAIRKYGDDNFIPQLLVECEKHESDEYEEMFIELYDTTNPTKGYNIRSGGNTRGQSECTRQLLSALRCEKSGKTLPLGISDIKPQGVMKGYQVRLKDLKTRVFRDPKYTLEQLLEAAVYYKENKADPEWYVRRYKTHRLAP